jgi:hypothetical protein
VAHDVDHRRLVIPKCRRPEERNFQAGTAPGLGDLVRVGRQDEAIDDAGGTRRTGGVVEQ